METFFKGNYYRQESKNQGFLCDFVHTNILKNYKYNKIISGRSIFSIMSITNRLLLFIIFYRFCYIFAIFLKMLLFMLIFVTRLIFINVTKLKSFYGPCNKIRKVYDIRSIFHNLCCSIRFRFLFLFDYKDSLCFPFMFFWNLSVFFLTQALKNCSVFYF